jgi:ribosomal protein L11 methyltransferase
MEYFEVRFEIPKTSEEVLVAFLADAGFDMFDEYEKGIRAYIPAEGRGVNEIRNLVGTLPAEFIGDTWTVHRLEDRNWNEEWEKSFDPVTVAGKVMVRAPFHPAPEEGLVDLVIEPKMSFGTGHHPTTALMIEGMLDLDFNDKRVLDMGCGSGVLAILAARLGAASVLAVDIDDWSVENTLENIDRNKSNEIKVLKGNSSVLAGHDFDVVLANINRNILLQDIPAYASVMRSGGLLLTSGFLEQDVKVLTECAVAAGLRPDGLLRSENWRMLQFVK